MIFNSLEVEQAQLFDDPKPPPLAVKKAVGYHKKSGLENNKMNSDQELI